MDKQRAAPPGTAVALRYDGSGAPRVVAKGKGEIADHIVEMAREHHIPLRHDGELAELLSAVELGREIPEALYVAVAQVLVFVFALSGRTPPRPGDSDPV